MNEAPLLRRISSGHIGEVWDFVSHGLAQIRQECPSVPWTEAHVFYALSEGHGALYVHDHGFVVLAKKAEEVSRRPYLSVWLVWFEPGEAERIEDDLMAWLDRACKDTGCDWWEGSSTRNGWMRALRRVCQPAFITYRRAPL